VPTRCSSPELSHQEKHAAASERMRYKNTNVPPEETSSAT